jgi:hypothetical protein
MCEREDMQADKLRPSRLFYAFLLPFFCFDQRGIRAVLPAPPEGAMTLRLTLPLSFLKLNVRFIFL